jgi:hypothetical protein
MAMTAHDQKIIGCLTAQPLIAEVMNLEPRPSTREPLGEFVAVELREWA